MRTAHIEHIEDTNSYRATFLDGEVIEIPFGDEDLLARVKANKGVASMEDVVQACAMAKRLRQNTPRVGRYDFATKMEMGGFVKHSLEPLAKLIDANAEALAGDIEKERAAVRVLFGAITDVLETQSKDIAVLHELVAYLELSWWGKFKLGWSAWVDVLFGKEEPVDDAISNAEHLDVLRTIAEESWRRSIREEPADKLVSANPEE